MANTIFVDRVEWFPVPLDKVGQAHDTILGTGMVIEGVVVDGRHQYPGATMLQRVDGALRIAAGEEVLATYEIGTWWKWEQLACSQRLGLCGERFLLNDEGAFKCEPLGHWFATREDAEATTQGAIDAHYIARALEIGS